MNVTTFYLEMKARDEFRPKPTKDPRFRVLEASVKQWEFNRFLYSFIGAPWKWRDKLSWEDSKWKGYVDSTALRTFVAYYDGSLAGYFELSFCDNEVEIAYFGLSTYFIGKGFGGALLTSAIEKAWNYEPKRVWVHTCTLDHPSALENYLARGMRIYKKEEK
jgi:RimJ/RimL family protein N-acetyltransferase